ncbi:metal ABC transporter solute-binding protein, Zn/Mn family [Desulfocurvus sp. DL9XJH121]
MKRLAVVFVFVLLACVPVAHAAGLGVAVSIAPQAWFVRHVAGDLAEVTVMVPPGASPHGFEPKPGQMRAVARADLYLALGLGFEEAWLPRFLSANPKLRVARMEAGIHRVPMEPAHHDEPRREAGQHREPPQGPPPGHGGHEAEHGPEGHAEHHHGGLDPHVWLSPELAKTMARNVRDALAQADPAHAGAYDAGLARTLAEIGALQADLRAELAGVRGRTFMIFHPSWGYFAREFGLRQMAVEAGGREPSARELAFLVTLAHEHGVRTVFVQPQMSSRAASMLADELGGDVAEADPLAPDWVANLRAVAHRLASAMGD